MPVFHNGAFKVLGAGTGLLLAMTATYAACGGGTSEVQYDCLRNARYRSIAEIEAKQIMLFADWLDAHGIVLTSAQQSRLDANGNLVGEFVVDRPVKHADGTVEMPDGWLPSLPADHPWQTPPASDDALFAAWFEVRIVDPLLYDPAVAQHIAWAGQYLLLTGSAGDDVIVSLPAVDSGCR